MGYNNGELYLKSNLLQKQKDRKTKPRNIFTVRGG